MRNQLLHGVDAFEHRTRALLFPLAINLGDERHGTGLGLSTTMAIVKSHGGFVSVVSKKGKGSTFKVYLPSSIGPSPKETPAEPSQIAIGKGELVLVVDDEAALREIAKAALERNGYRAIVAANGAVAVAAYAREPKIEAALIDMTMPVMDGVSTILALRQLNPKLGIVILVRRRNRAQERAALGRLLDSAGESGMRGNINFA